MLAIAMIMARGGSKRLPGKNVMDVGDLPMIAHAIKAAQAADLVEFVVVSSDSDEILDVAMHYGARVVERSPGLASDTAKIHEAAAEGVCRFMAEEFGHPLDDPRGTPEITCILQGNCPVWEPRSLDKMIRQLYTSRFTSVASAHPVREHPEWMRKLGPSGVALPFCGVEDAFRQQELPDKYRLDGQAMVLYTRHLLNGQDEVGLRPYDWMGARMGLYVRPWIYGLDVDEPWDLVLAEAAMKWLENHGSD